MSLHDSYIRLGELADRLDEIDRRAVEAFGGFAALGERLERIGLQLTEEITSPLTDTGSTE